MFFTSRDILFDLFSRKISKNLKMVRLCLSFSSSVWLIYQYFIIYTIKILLERYGEDICLLFLVHSVKNIVWFLRDLEILADDQFFLEIIALLSSISFDDVMKVIQVTSSFSFYKSCCERSYLATFKSILLKKSQYISSGSSQYDGLVPVQVPPPCGDLALVIPCL